MAEVDDLLGVKDDSQAIGSVHRTELTEMGPKDFFNLGSVCLFIVGQKNDPRLPGFWPQDMM